MNVEEAKATLRRVDRKNYPELHAYSDEAIWKDSGGPGGLYLAAKMSRELNLREGDVVLDLGCGLGESSVFLAKHFGLQVIAVDLWHETVLLHEKFTRRGFRSRIVPLNLDARRPLPFAEGYFDAVFCMNALSFFGGDVESLRRLTKYLRQGGVFCAGGECMSKEFSPEQLANPPEVYSFVEGIWENDFLRLHSPAWWERLFKDSGVLEAKKCGELDDGVILHEEKILAKSPEGYLGLSPAQAQEIEMRQILYGREHEPHMTVFIIAASKK